MLLGWLAFRAWYAKRKIAKWDGVDLDKDFPMPLGSYVSINLTTAGPLQGWPDGEIFRAIRNGIDWDDQVRCGSLTKPRPQLTPFCKGMQRKSYGISQWQHASG